MEVAERGGALEAGEDFGRVQRAHRDEVVGRPTGLVAGIAHRVDLDIAAVSEATVLLDQRLGHHEEAHAGLADASSRLSGDPSRRRRALIHLAHTGLYRTDFEGMREWAERARITAEAEQAAVSARRAAA